MEQRTYVVDGMTCEHCVRAVSEEVSAVVGVVTVEVDLDTKLVEVTGVDVDDAAVVAAVEEAGYEAVPGARTAMSAGARLATFALVLVAAFALAFGVGAAMEGSEPAGDDRVELDDDGPHDEVHDEGAAT